VTPEALAEVERVRQAHGDEAAAVVARFIDGTTPLTRPRIAPATDRPIIGKKRRRGPAVLDSEAHAPGWTNRPKATPPPAGDKVRVHMVKRNGTIGRLA
jgi:hypothetical protein